MNTCPTDIVNDVVFARASPKFKLNNYVHMLFYELCCYSQHRSISDFSAFGIGGKRAEQAQAMISQRVTTCFIDPGRVALSPIRHLIVEGLNLRPYQQPT